MLSESEFKVLKLVESKPYLVCEEGSAASDFDLTCEVALELYERGVLRSTSSEPYRRNMGVNGPRYNIVGPFHLSMAAAEAVRSRDYDEYTRARPPPSEWTLANKIAVVGIVVVILIAVFAS